MSKLSLNKETLRPISTEALGQEVHGAISYEDWKRGIKIIVSCPTWCSDSCGSNGTGFSYTCG